jgi:flagellar protein FlgJ
MLPKADIYTDFQGLAGLRKEARQQTPEAIKKVARQFESLFVQMMLKSMRDAVPESELFGSHQQQIYRDMFDKQISMNVSNGGGIGLAAVIERQLMQTSKDSGAARELRDYFRNPVRAQKNHAMVSATEIRGLHEPGDSDATNDDEGWDSPQAFVDELWLHATRAGDELGVDPRVLLAQSALETGWGRFVPKGADGSSSYNLFGIKADSRWQGKTVSLSTLEYRHGTMQREQARFRAYDSVGEAFNDYVQFIRSNPRYRAALEKGYDGEAYVRELQRAGYATDPDYAAKISRVWNSEWLQTRVSGLKNGTNVPLT